jgi:predicted RNase H-like HicB family nuclease
LLRAARAIAERYRFLVEPDADGDGYVGSSVEMPGVLGGGPDRASCIADTLEATVTSVATMLEKHQKPPSPSLDHKRDQQVNIRLTAAEKLRLDEASRREGFRSLSDFLRAAGLARSH